MGVYIVAQRVGGYMWRHGGVGGHMGVVMVVTAVVMELHLVQEVLELQEAILSHLCHQGPLQVPWQQGEVWAGPRTWEAV